MQQSPSFTHVFHLVRELRRAAIENQNAAAEQDEGSFHLCLGAALANDAADALEALIAQRAGNDAGHPARRSVR